MGMYVGRVWIGKGTMTVKAAPADSGAAFEMTLDVEADLMDTKMVEHNHSLLAKDLTVVAADSTGDDEARKNLPDEKMLEDLMATMMTCEEKGDEAKVTIGTTVHKLHKSTNPAKKGAWLIYGLGQ